MKIIFPRLLHCYSISPLFKVIFSYQFDSIISLQTFNQRETREWWRPEVWCLRLPPPVRHHYTTSTPEKIIYEYKNIWMRKNYLVEKDMHCTLYCLCLFTIFVDFFPTWTFELGFIQSREIKETERDSVPRLAGH